MKKILFIVIPILFLSAFQVNAGEEWSLSKDKEGIKVYTRKYQDYSYKEYKGIAIIEGEVDELVDILKDVSTYDQWSFKCLSKSAKLLKKDETTGVYHVYMEIKAPLVANRDVITVYKFNEPTSDGSVTVEFWGDADYIPKKDGKVRVPELKGYWKIIPHSDGKIKVVHQAFTHPGGSPPAAFVNNSTVEAPYSMLKILRNIIEE